MIALTRCCDMLGFSWRSPGRIPLRNNQSECGDHRLHERHCVSVHWRRQAGHTSPVSNTFHSCPHVQDQAVVLVGRAGTVRLRDSSLRRVRDPWQHPVVHTRRIIMMQFLARGDYDHQNSHGAGHEELDRRTEPDMRLWDRLCSGRVEYPVFSSPRYSPFAEENISASSMSRVGFSASTVR